MMKNAIIISPIKNINTIVVAIILLFLISSCSKKVVFLTSQVVPAARGDVKIKKDHNKNYDIQVRLTDLAEVQRLQPPRLTYVVWLITDTGLAKNIGQINSATGLLSKKLRAYFETVSSIKPTKIFITAEDDANVQIPGNQIILSTEDF